MASAMVNELYFAAGRKALYAKQGRASAMQMADQTRALFTADTNLMNHFNRNFAGGRWNHFMDQSHLGYTTLQDPPPNSLNPVRLIEPEVAEAAALGVAAEGSESSWPGATNFAELPEFDSISRPERYIEVFNRGKTPFDFTATVSAGESWISLSKTSGS